MQNEIMTRSNRYLARMVLLLLVAWGLLVYRVDAPWHEFHSANGAWISASIRNYQQYGMATFGFVQTKQTGPVDPDNYQPHFHHPPMYVWLPGMMAMVVELTEVAVRFPFMASALISIAALYVLARRFFDERVALWGAVLYTAMPLTTYQGRSPDMMLLSMMVAILYTVVFMNWLRRPTWRRFALLAGLAVFGVYTFWVLILYVAILGGVAFLIGKNTHRRQTVLMAAIGFLSVASLFLLYSQAVPNLPNRLYQTFLWRSSGTSSADKDIFQACVQGGAICTEEAPVSFTWFQFWQDFVYDFFSSMTPGLLLLGVIGTPFALRRLDKQRRWIMIALYGVVFVWVLLLRNGNYTHHYYSIYMFIPIALCGAVIMPFAFQKPRPEKWYKRWARGLILALTLTGIANGLYLYAYYHSSGSLPHMVLGDRVIYHQQTIDTLANHTAQDDLILTNVEFLYEFMALEYYAYRNVTWNTEPDEALQVARATERPVFYMFCAPEIDIPAGYEDFPYTEGENTCLVFDMTPVARQ